MRPANAAPEADAPDNKAGTEELREDRIERFMKLTYAPAGREDADGNQLVQTAFTRKEAGVLADVTVIDEVAVGAKEKKVKRYESPLHQSKVQKMLDQGCTPQLVLRILGD